MNKLITVKGMGSVSAKPDLIVIAMKLQSENKDYSKALAKGANELEAIREAVAKAGLDKSELKTTNFGIDTVFDSIKDKNGNYERIFKGYVCSHGLKIEFDFAMKVLSNTIYAISKCAATPEFSIQFSVKDKNAVSEELLVNATENARSKAKILAKASGVKLGDLVSIDYSWGELHLYSQTRYENACMDSAPMMNPMEIEPEDIDVNDTVTFVWEIAK